MRPTLLFFALALLLGNPAWAINCEKIMTNLQANTRSTAQVYLQLISHLSQYKNALPPKFYQAAAEAAEPLNPFDFPVNNLSPQSKRNFEGAFKQILKRKDLRRSWAEIKIGLAGIAEDHGWGAKKRRAIADETKHVWFPVDLGKTKEPPLPSGGFTSGGKSVYSFDGQHLWHFVTLFNTPDTFVIDTQSGKVNHLTYGFSEFPQIFVNHQDRPILTFNDRRTLTIADGASEAQLSQVDLAKLWEKPALQGFEVSSMKAFAVEKPDGSFGFLLAFTNPETLVESFFLLSPDGKDLKPLNIALQQSQVSYGPDAETYIVGKKEDKLQVFSIFHKLTMHLDKDVWSPPGQMQKQLSKDERFTRSLMSGFKLLFTPLTKKPILLSSGMEGSFLTDLSSGSVWSLNLKGYLAQIKLLETRGGAGFGLF